MQRPLTAFLCAAFAVAALPALAEAPSAAVLSSAPTAGSGSTDTIGKEQMVQNWILCTSEENAESIARARQDGVEPALKVYGDLASAKACGVFPVLRVILEQPLYQSPEGGHQTRVYRASVNIGTGWPTGFVIYGGLAD